VEELTHICKKIVEIDKLKTLTIKLENEFMEETYKEVEQMREDIEYLVKQIVTLTSILITNHNELDINTIKLKEIVKRYNYNIEV